MSDIRQTPEPTDRGTSFPYGAIQPNTSRDEAAYADALDSAKLAVAARPLIEADRRRMNNRVLATHAPHLGNHIGDWACNQKEAHCWADNQPWPCDTIRLFVVVVEVD